MLPPSGGRWKLGVKALKREPIDTVLLTLSDDAKPPPADVLTGALPLERVTWTRGRRGRGLMAATGRSAWLSAAGRDLLLAAGDLPLLGFFGVLPFAA